MNTTSKPAAQKKTRSKKKSSNSNTQPVQLLKQFFALLPSTMDETELLSRAVSLISEHYDYAVVAINIIDNVHQLFILRALSARLAEDSETPSYLPLNSGVIGLAAQQRRPILITETESCNYYVEKFPATRSELACPIINRDQVFGVLNLESDRASAFTQNDLEIIETLASGLAIALANLRSARQIDELQSAKHALLERLSHDYQHIFENALQGMSRSTPDGRFIIVNPAFARMLGYNAPEDLLKVDIVKEVYANPETRRQVTEQLEKSGKITDFETQFKRRDGQLIDIKLNGRAIRDNHSRTLYYDGIVEDISEQKRQLQTVKWRDRMATMGELAAAIAHEIRNPLAAVLNSAEELQARIQLTGTNQRLLEIILEEVERLERIVRDFLEFARPSAPKFAAADLHQILDKTLELVTQSHQLRPEVVIKREFVSSLPLLSLDADRMLQVFLNIILNAAQAIRRVGTISVKTSLLPTGETTVTSDSYIVIEISDTGPGIRSDCLARIFEPFFTTKPSGTGLGLPIAKQIIEMHGGTIKVESKEGSGTIVEITLPNRSVTLG